MSIKRRLSSIMLWAVFVGALLCTATTWYFFTGLDHQLASIASIIAASISGFLLTRREPVQTWLQTPAVLFGLFLINIVASVVVLLTAPGVSGLIGGIVLAVIGLGAGVGALLLRRAPAPGGIATVHDQASTGQTL